jgi:hypothetical protein
VAFQELDEKQRIPGARPLGRDEVVERLLGEDRADGGIRHSLDHRR